MCVSIGLCRVGAAESSDQARDGKVMKPVRSSLSARLSIRLYPSVCPFLSIRFCPFVSTCLSVYPPLRPSVPVCPLLSIRLCPSVNRSIRLSVGPPPVYRSVLAHSPPLSCSLSLAMTLAAVVLELVLALVQAVVLVSSDAGRGGVGSSTKGARRQNEGGKSDDAENVDATFCLAARHLQDHHVRLPASGGWMSA